MTNTQDMLGMGKKLLAKGIELNDPELVAMATGMLCSIKSKKVKEDTWGTYEEECQRIQNVVASFEAVGGGENVRGLQSSSIIVDEVMYPKSKGAEIEKLKTVKVDAVKTTKKRGRPSKKAVEPEKTVKITQKTKKNPAEEFTLQRVDAKMMKYAPVKGTGKNLWKDDGIEAKDDITPDFVPVARERSVPRKITVICGQDENKKRRDDEGCGKKVLMEAKYAREYFLCDDCLESKVKRSNNRG